MRWRKRRETGEEALVAGQRAADELAAALRSGACLPSVQAPGLSLDPGEDVHADVMCGTARFYGTEVAYPQGRVGYFEDHPTFGRRWVDNRQLEARRRRDAEIDAQDRWRDHTAARVVLTSQGFRLRPAPYGSDWLPFDHVLLTGMKPRPACGQVVLTYSTCAPLHLTGPAVPWLVVALENLLMTSDWGL
ncbi:hypothetical protein AB0F64_36125 [Streptomyces sp. NPDC026294]|uniref:hypothetical protein n=1 Tax=Streptomyces sp. NPDC026294 TaxID=3155362 RepID=UPI0034117C0D